MSSVNLIYLTYNASADIPHLPSLVASAGEELPVIALDNASSDDSVEKLRALELDVAVMEENLGFTAGINEGLRRCEAEWAVIANPDVRPLQNGWLTSLLDVPDDCGILGARLTDGMQVLGGGIVADRSMPLVRSAWRPALDGVVLCPELLGWARMTQNIGGPRDHTEPREVAWVAFALCALRMDMVRQIGLLDQSYWHFVSDNEYCLRAWSHNWSVRYQPVTFLHPGNTALQTAPSEVHAFVRDDIRRWCRAEPIHLQTSRWS